MIVKQTSSNNLAEFSLCQVRLNQSFRVRKTINVRFFPYKIEGLNAIQYPSIIIPNKPIIEKSETSQTSKVLF